jgi:hypothetical protein
MNFWHGGNLDDYSDIIAQKNGRYEYGAGLYLTTHYGTAAKYAKGSRKLYLVTVKEGVDINKALLDAEKVKDFINAYVIGNMKKMLWERLQKFNVDGKIKAFALNNNILNEKAIKATNTRYLRSFYVENGIDYEIHSNTFGWGEKMMVLYNMNKIINLIYSEEFDYRLLYISLFKGKVPIPAKALVNKYAREHNNCLVPEMHFLSMIYEIISCINKY